MTSETTKNLVEGQDYLFLLKFLDKYFWAARTWYADDAYKQTYPQESETEIMWTCSLPSPNEFRKEFLNEPLPCCDHKDGKFVAGMTILPDGTASDAYEYHCCKCPYVFVFRHPFDMEVPEVVQQESARKQREYEMFTKSQDKGKIEDLIVTIPPNDRR